MCTCIQAELTLPEEKLDFPLLFLSTRIQALPSLLQLFLGFICFTVSIRGLPKTRETWTYWRESNYD